MLVRVLLPLLLSCVGVFGAPAGVPLSSIKESPTILQDVGCMGSDRQLCNATWVYCIDSYCEAPENGVSKCYCWIQAPGRSMFILICSRSRSIELIIHMCISLVDMVEHTVSSTMLIIIHCLIDSHLNIVFQVPSQHHQMVELLVFSVKPPRVPLTIQSVMISVKAWKLENYGPHSDIYR